MTEQTFKWDDVRRIADELRLEIHLAGMDARDRWQALQPRLAELQKNLSRTTEQASKAVADEMAAIGAALRRLRDDLKAKAPKTPPAG